MAFEADYAIGLALRDDEIKRCRAMPYQDYLALPWWDFVRTRTLRRANYRCELCQESQATEAHHTTYKRIGCEKPDDMVALCRDCHEHVTLNGLAKVPRSDLLKQRRAILYSPEFGLTHGRLDY